MGLIISNTPTTYPYWFIIGDFKANHGLWSQGSSKITAKVLQNF